MSAFFCRRVDGVVGIGVCCVIVERLAARGAHMVRSETASIHVSAIFIA